VLILPQRNDLVRQTADIVRSEIRRGQWRGQLPSERQLSVLLKISRPTLRQALGQLLTERLLEAEPRRGYRIVKSRRSSRLPRLQTVHLLSPDPLEQLRHQSQFWIAEVRQSLLRSGHELILHHGTQYAREGTARALPELVAKNAPGVWLLAHSTRAVQAWFVEQQLPAVISGFTHPGVKLPSVCVDVGAASRHAVGLLSRLGHKRIVLIHEATDRAGDLISEQGFEQGIGLAVGAELQARIVRYPSSDPEIIVRTVRRLFQEKPASTALFVGTALGYATISTHLLRSGMKIPEDVSLLCREEDNFLLSLLPRPAFYMHPAVWFASRICDHLRKLLAGQPTSLEPSRVVPEYSAGGSVARCI